LDSLPFFLRFFARGEEAKFRIDLGSSAVASPLHHADYNREFFADKPMQPVTRFDAHHFAYFFRPGSQQVMCLMC
jgi:hypothetical protein